MRPSARADWMRDARWGVFMHFLAECTDLPADQWNRRIDGFDVEALAIQLHSVRAGWFTITLGQNSGHYLTPNSVYDRLTGIQPSKCANRDLIADLHQALSKRGIRLNYRSFAAAARKGNPAAVLAFNRGVVMPIHSDCEEDDYTAGEIDDPRAVQADEFWTDGVQLHMLSFLGTAWSAGAPRFADAEAAALTRRLVAKRMAVTWDVPHSPAGLIADPFYRQLKAIGA